MLYSQPRKLSPPAWAASSGRSQRRRYPRPRTRGRYEEAPDLGAARPHADPRSDRGASQPPQDRERYVLDGPYAGGGRTRPRPASPPVPRRRGPPVRRQAAETRDANPLRGGGESGSVATARVFGVSVRS